MIRIGLNFILEITFNAFVELKQTTVDSTVILEIVLQRARNCFWHPCSRSSVQVTSL